MRSDLIVIATGRVLQIVISLLAVRLFTSMLSAAEVGNLYLLNSIVALFGFALLNPVGMYFYRKMHRWVEEGVLWNRLALYFGYLGAVALLSTVVVTLLHRVLRVGHAIDLPLLLLFVAAYLFFNTCNQNVIALLNLLERRVGFVLFTLATVAAGLLLSVLTASSVPTALAWLSGQVAAQAAVTAVAIFFLAGSVPFRFDRRQAVSVVTASSMHGVLAFVLPLSCTTLLVWVQTQSYRLIVEQRIGLEFLGQIGLGLSIAANIASAVESIVHQVYMPLFYREVNSSDHAIRTAACNRMFQLTIPLFLALTLFVSFLAPFLVTILAHARFGGAFLFIVFGAWIELFRMVTGILSTAAHAEMQTGYLVKAYFAGGLSAAAGVFLASFASRYDLLIPAVLLCSGGMTMWIMYRQMQRIIRVKVGIRWIIRGGLVSLPFAVSLCFYTLRADLRVSLAVTAIFGAYFIISQYLLNRRYLVDPAVDSREANG